jgi:ABC-type transport system substrate-binding protein
LNLTEGLAKPIESANEKEVVLQLKPEAKWSDGTPVTAEEVVRSINHARELHEEILKGLFESVKPSKRKMKEPLSFG